MICVTLLAVYLFDKAQQGCIIGLSGISMFDSLSVTCIVIISKENGLDKSATQTLSL